MGTMADETTPEDKSAFIGEPAHYERRVVAFYDIMGWRDKIADAGDDIEKVTTLKNMVRLFSFLREQNPNPAELAVRVSTFSDNVVVSMAMHKHSLGTMLLRLAVTQYGAAKIGFLIRGGVTIGNILHDENVVLGPALNRAYHLENKIADKPRIVVDSELVNELAELGDIVAVEDGVHFINTWKRQFVAVYETVPRLRGQKTGPLVDAQDSLILILQALGAELMKPSLDEKNRKRINWLYKRVFAEFGMPAANLDELLETMRPS